MSLLSLREGFSFESLHFFRVSECFHGLWIILLPICSSSSFLSYFAHLQGVRGFFSTLPVAACQGRVSQEWAVGPLEFSAFNYLFLQASVFIIFNLCPVLMKTWWNAVTSFNVTWSSEMQQKQKWGRSAAVLTLPPPPPRDSHWVPSVSLILLQCCHMCCMKARMFVPAPSMCP